MFAEAIRLNLLGMGATKVSVATTARQALELARQHRPDLALVDIGLPDQSGILLGRLIIEELPETKVVALTAFEDDKLVREALRVGFRGFLTKSTEARQFRTILRSVLDGQVVFPQRLGRRVTGMFDGSDEAELLARQLTPRELEVLQLLSEGAGGSEIARRLHVSPNTVRTHVQGILSKLQVHSRLEAVAFAMRHGLARARS
ncbi:MAG: LuxR C-terminal-related transcriptional regulator [Candidatus Velamenicoccus archaeovorus]